MSGLKTNLKVIGAVFLIFGLTILFQPAMAGEGDLKFSGATVSASTLETLGIKKQDFKFFNGVEVGTLERIIRAVIPFDCAFFNILNADIAMISMKAKTTSLSDDQKKELLSLLNAVSSDRNGTNMMSEKCGPLNGNEVRAYRARFAELRTLLGDSGNPSPAKSAPARR